MADIYFYQEEDTEDNEGVYSDTEVPHNPDDLLPPIEKLEKYAQSENIFNRQIVARTILETLRAVVEDENDVAAALDVMNKLADDVEPSVRAELMEQIPHIAMFCQEFKSQLCTVVPSHLLPMVVKFLTDSNNQVRKTSQAALLVLLEQGLVEKSDVQEQVCPVIIKLTEADSLDDYRTEAVALLSKMAPLIGRDMVESLFLERFAALCMDPLFHVRKLCAANFGDFSSVVGSEPTEKVLLPKFFYLCEDGVWGVRKACADVFMPVSCVCSSAVRQQELSPLFINLLRDQSRWVRMAAFQALGPFISTFADPSITALLHNDNGEIVITEPDTLAERLDILEKERAREREEKETRRKEEQTVIKEVVPEEGDVSQAENMELVQEDDEESKDSKTSQDDDDLSVEEKRAKAYQESRKEEEDFNSFHFWREPLPEVDDLASISKSDEEQLAEGLEKIQVTDEAKEDSDCSDDTSTMELFRPHAGSTSSPTQGGSSQSQFDARWESFVSGGSAKAEASGGGGETSSANTTADSSPKTTSANTTNNDSNTSSDVPLDPALPRGPPATDQSIVPQLLIDHYVSMINPSRAQTVDNEIARHCAFSLPAVALTLGRSNWPLLRETYEALATDMQWKVRRTLASSIHELGVILGEESSGQDLIPIFNGFLKDLDEVRQGLLKHLADFMKLLGQEHRREYLPKLSEFLKMDNDRNWRFRQELSEQLERLIPLYTPEEIEEHISPIAMVLVHDKVASVRDSVTNVIANIILSLNRSERPELATYLLHCVIESLAHESLWVHRQTFATVCLRLHTFEALPHEDFAEVMLSPLLDLAEDKVPNVRLAVARTLKFITKTTDFYKNDNMNPHFERLVTVERNLKNDVDVDVRYLYGGSAKKFGSCGELSDDEEYSNVAASTL